MTHQVLIVSDKEETTSELKSALEQQNIEVLCVSSVAAALDGFSKHSCCLVFIDINLSLGEKTEMIRVMRDIKIVPIIVLTGPLKKEDLKELFQAGASVIVKKPIDYEICAMQVNNFIDLYSNIENSVSKNHPIVFGTEFIIDPQHRQAFLKGAELILTRLEFDLLLCLASYPGQTLSHEQLYSQVWDVDRGINVNAMVKVHIGKLRKKLASASNHTYIESVWGVGYKFIPPYKR